jgi:hypothetical protein
VESTGLLDQTGAGTGYSTAGPYWGWYSVVCCWTVDSTAGQCSKLLDQTGAGTVESTVLLDPTGVGTGYSTAGPYWGWYSVVCCWTVESTAGQWSLLLDSGVYCWTV